MTSLRDTLLAEINAFVGKHGITETEFGLRSVGDGSFIKRLRDGRNVRISTVDKARAWMLAHGAPRPRPRRRQTNEAVV